MPLSLAASQLESTSVGGSTVDSVNAAAVAQFSTDFGGTITLNVAKGTPASNVFGGSAKSRDISVSLNLGNGAWSASNGTSGVLGGAALASFKTNTLVPLRNQCETFVLNNVLVGGSQVSWT